MGDQPSGWFYYPKSAAAEKFDHLQSRGLIASLLRLFTQKPDAKLLSFDQVADLLRSRQQIERGRQTIPIDSIVGSVGRYRDFDRAFLPLSGADKERWKQLDVALNTLRPLPPIDVYKIGDVYFVRDGNHRVSVAKANGLVTIEAEVTEVETRVPLTPDLDVDDLIIKVEYARFLEQTHLDETRPDPKIELTEPGNYQVLLEHIEVHRYYLGLRWKRQPLLQEAAASWHDHVYLPVVEAIREIGILAHFPRRTEADLYLWVARERERLREQYGEMPTDKEAAESLAGDHGDSPLARLTKAVERAIKAAIGAAGEPSVPQSSGVGIPAEGSAEE
jgi:hypothetical protein